MPLLMNFYQPVCILKTYTHQNQLAGGKDTVKTKEKEKKKSLNSFKSCFPELSVAGITYLN